MIDWITLVAPLTHQLGEGGPFYAGEVMATKPDPFQPGAFVLDWAVLKRKAIEGSYSSTLQIQSTRDALGRPAIWLSFCPAKWFQGHNIFGTEDLRGLVLETLHRVCSSVGAAPSAEDLELWNGGAIQLRRVDVTQSYQLGNRERVRAALRALDATAHLKHRGRGHFNGDSITWGKGSRRESLTAYAKGPELEVKGHGLPHSLQQTSLPAFADGLLRVELRLLSMGLKRRRLDWVASWADNTATELHASFMRGLEVAEATILDAHDLEGLPRRLRAVYQLWRDGHDLRELYPKNTFYRHRRALLAHGIDVAIKQERTSPDLSNVVPLRVVLTAVPVSVPDWAEGTPLFFEPRQRFGT